MNRTPSAGLLLYASDFTSGTVDVYAYPAGTLVGQATGFSHPRGLCSDKTGNVYVADDANAYEISHRTTTVINTFNVGGITIGCSVAQNGDLAVTRWFGNPSGPGGVWIYPPGQFYSGPGYEDWPAGYDANGNLFVEAEAVTAYPCSSTACLFELKAGSSSWQLLHFNKTLHYATAVELMGKKLGVGDQPTGSALYTTLYLTTVSGTRARARRTVVFHGNSCAGSFSTAFDQWANVSNHPNGLQERSVASIIAGNAACTPSPIDTWAIPAGGNPTLTLYTEGGQIGGNALIR